MLRKFGSRSFVWGFLFGTVGLLILSVLSLISPFFEFWLDFLASPSRVIGQYIDGPGGSSAEIIILMAVNGFLYGSLFRLITNSLKNKNS